MSRWNWRRWLGPGSDPASPAAAHGEAARPVMRETFIAIAHEWARSSAAFKAAVEGVTPHFAAEFDLEPVDFTFDAFRQARPGWSWVEYELPEASRRSLKLYLPAEWTEAESDGRFIHILDARGVVHQTCVLSSVDSWVQKLEDFTDPQTRDVVGFTVDSLGPDGSRFHRWVIVTARAGRLWPCAVWGAYSAGDRLLLISGAAEDRNALEEQLTSLVSGSPWQREIDAIE